jgi:hypothetical protein
VLDRVLGAVETVGLPQSTREARRAGWLEGEVCTDMTMEARKIAECCVCSSTARGEWLPSGDRDRRMGQTPCANFVCNACHFAAADRRAFMEAKRGVAAARPGAWDARPVDEEAEIQRRLSLQFRQKIAPWQMP